MIVGFRDSDPDCDKPQSYPLNGSAVAAMVCTTNANFSRYYSTFSFYEKYKQCDEVSERIIHTDFRS